jgi:hypothetical protein
MEHGISSKDAKFVHEYTSESPLEQLQKFDEARAAGVRAGLAPGNSAAERAALMGKDITDPDKFLRRGSDAPYDVLKTPQERNAPSPNSPRQMNVIFVAEPNSGAYATGGDVTTHMVSSHPLDSFFNPDDLGHRADFIEHYNDLYPYSPTSGEKHVETWGGRAGWDELERDPRVAATVKSMGYPGWRFKETGDNRAIFDPTELRSPLAAFNPEKAGVRNLFAGAGGATLAAALLGQGLPVSPSDGSQ